MATAPSTVTKQGKRCMTSSTPDLGSSGCAVAPVDSDNRENRDKSSIVTRAASKRFVDKMDGPSALGKRAGDALKQDGVLQPAFGSPSIPASTPEDLLRPTSNASSPALPFSPSECPSAEQRFFTRKQLRKMHGQDPSQFTPEPPGHWAQPGSSPDWPGKRGKERKAK
jgi:hypothetical protein